MKADVKFWPDTKSLDLTIYAETETELALLHLLKARTPEWDQSTTPEKTVRLSFDVAEAIAKPAAQVQGETGAIPA